MVIKAGRGIHSGGSAPEKGLGHRPGQLPCPGVVRQVLQGQQVPSTALKQVVVAGRTCISCGFRGTFPAAEGEKLGLHARPSHL